MVRLNYNINVGDTISIPMCSVSANISVFQHMKGIVSTVVKRIDKEKDSVYCENQIILDLDVAAYFNGEVIDDDYISHKLNSKDVYLPNIDQTVIVKDSDIYWRTFHMLVCDFVSGKYNGLNFSWYNGGWRLNSDQIWKAIKDD